MNKNTIYSTYILLVILENKQRYKSISNLYCRDSLLNARGKHIKSQPIEGGDRINSPTLSPAKHLLKIFTLQLKGPLEEEFSVLFI